IETGKVDTFQSFDDFWNAFKSQLEYVIGKLVYIQREITHEFLRRELPHVYLSILYPDSIERGRDFTNEGAKYHWSSFTATGLANLIDSIYSIKTLVFDEKYVPFYMLLDAIQNDFQGYETLLSKIKRLPKYGNGNEEVDKIAN